MKSLSYIPEGEEWAFRVSMRRRERAALRLKPNGDIKRAASALRRIFPEFASLSSPAILERLRCVELKLGPFEEAEARRLFALSREADLNVEISCFVEEAGLLVDTRGPSAWLIEDDEENRAVIKDAIKRGVRVDQNEN